MYLNDKGKKIVIKNLLAGEDYRVVVVDLINFFFLESVIAFLKKVVDAKLSDKTMTPDWYKRNFLASGRPKEEIATNSGLNIKTVQNMRNTVRKEVVIEVANKNLEKFRSLVEEVVADKDGVNLKLTLKSRDVSVDLDVNESLVVINAIAVKRAAIRGGLWSEVGKAIEVPLMKTLCVLYSVPLENYQQKEKAKKKKIMDTEREVDFYLFSGDKSFKCEVKLMGKGNPESADGAFARDVAVLVADKLSEKGKKIADERGMHWLEFREKPGFRKFEEILKLLKIPHKKLAGNDYDKVIDDVLGEI